jgi:hypothetical protein
MMLRPSEWIALLYFSSLIATAVLLRAPSHVRRGVVSAAVTLIAVILVLASLDGRAAIRVRDCISLIYLPAGYWLPARLVGSSNQVLEHRLMALDRRWFGANGLANFAARAPRLLIEALELAYLLCYPMVPAGFAWLYLGGCSGETERFWTAVLLATFFCYGLLPWLPTRPPRAVETRPFGRAASKVRNLNLHVLGRASHQLNTFPSGHAAASVAVALCIGACTPVAGALFGFLAVGIMAGSITGRYHYAADAITGAIVAVMAFEISRFLIHPIG